MLAHPGHHSPSSIKQWRNAPLIWCLRYLYDWHDSGPKMWRGAAVEQGFAAVLRGAGVGDALAIAHLRYWEESKGEVSEEITAQEQLIEPMLRQASSWYDKTPLELAATQIRIEAYFDGVERPFLGFVDFGFMAPLDMDTKTTEVCPSKPRPDDLRQIAIYAHARGRPQSLLYVTDKKHAFFTPSEDELQAARRDMIAAAKSLERFLTVMPDRDTAIRSLPQSDHFSVSEAAKQKLAEIGV